MSTRSTNRSADGSFNESFDRSSSNSRTTHTIHHTILDQISEAIADTQAAMKTIKTDKVSTRTTIEIEGTSRTHSTTRGMGSRTGMTITKIEIGLATEDDQTNTNTTETNQKHR